MGAPIPTPPSIRREVQADRVIITRTWRQSEQVVGWILIAVIWNGALIAMYRTARTGPPRVWASPLIPWALGAIGLVLLGSGVVLGRRKRTVVLPADGSARPDVSGVLPTPRDEPAVDRAKAKH